MMKLFVFSHHRYDDLNIVFRFLNHGNLIFSFYVFINMFYCITTYIALLYYKRFLNLYIPLLLQQFTLQYIFFIFEIIYKTQKFVFIKI